MRIPVTAWVRQRNGVAHTSHLRAAGYSPHEVRRAVESGHLERVRRSWVLDDGCSPARRAAALVSGRVTCISAAQSMGLWTDGVEKLHLAVPATSSRVSAAGQVLHWARGPVPVARFEVDEPLLNVLFHAARCLEPDGAMVIWESALRKQLVSLPQLRRTQWHSRAVDLILEQVGTTSDSGVETRFVRLVRSCGVELVQQVWIDGHPLDGLIGERLAVQLDGFAFHSTARDRRRDLRADARLALLGYTVLRFDYQQVMFDPEYVRQTILNAIAQGLHLAGRH